MKKSLLAIAVLGAFTGVASAQSSVTLSGFLAAGWQSQPNSAHARGATITDYTIRFGAVEDLGNGMKALLTMELSDASGDAGETPVPANVVPTTTAGAPVGANGRFRKAIARDNTTLALAGKFGTVSYINTRSGDLLTRGMVAPASLPDGIYDSSNIIARAAIDYVVYASPSMGGVSVSAGWTESGLDGNATGAKTYVLTTTYAAGPVAAGLAYKKPKIAPAAGSQGYNLEAFATYDMGVAKFGFGFDGKRTGTGIATNVPNEKSAVSLGVSAPVGPMVLGVNYAKRDVNKLWEAVAMYNFSKRTALTASFGKQTVVTGPGASANPLTTDKFGQNRIRLQHTF
jgi:predicted porin